MKHGNLKLLNDDVGGKFVIYFLVEIFFIKQLSPFLRLKGKEKYIIN